MVARRVLFLIAILMGITALAVSVPPPAPRTSVPPAEATPEEPLSAGGVEAPPLVVETLNADEENQILDLEAGTPVHLEITSSRSVTVQVGTDGPIEPSQPGSAARFDLLYDSPGERRVRVVDGDREIGTLRVR